jgi:hypothetical protein
VPASETIGVLLALLPPLPPTGEQNGGYRQQPRADQTHDVLLSSAHRSLPVVRVRRLNDPAGSSIPSLVQKAME